MLRKCIYLFLRVWWIQFKLSADFPNYWLISWFMYSAAGRRNDLLCYRSVAAEYPVRHLKTFESRETFFLWLNIWQTKLVAALNSSCFPKGCSVCGQNPTENTWSEKIRIWSLFSICVSSWPQLSFWGLQLRRSSWWHDVVYQLNPVKIYIWVGVDDTKEVSRGCGYVIRMKTDEWKTIVY